MVSGSSLAAQMKPFTENNMMSKYMYMYIPSLELFCMDVGVHTCRRLFY